MRKGNQVTTWFEDLMIEFQAFVSNLYASVRVNTVYDSKKPYPIDIIQMETVSTTDLCFPDPIRTV